MADISKCSNGHCLHWPQCSQLVGECAHVQWALEGHEWEPAELCAYSCCAVWCFAHCKAGKRVHGSESTKLVPTEKEYSEPSKIQMSANAKFAWRY